jgi:hypothetical protein
MPSFMISDLWRSLLAVVLYPLFVMLPGYAIGWLLDLCGFRRRTQPFRLCLAICLSMATCPILIYLVERFGSRNLVWAALAIAWVFAALKGGLRPAFGSKKALLIWTAIAIVSLVDLEFAHRDYYSITALDFSIRTAFTHSIATTGIPPHNPFYFPGHAEPLRYHYFWMIPCAMVERAGFGLVGPRDAWIGSVVWSGIGLMAVVALCFRLLFYRGPVTFRRRALTGIFLLGATGLDILFVLLGWIMRAQGMDRAVVASLDWWNLSAQICGFVSTALWEAHYLAGLVVCITAFLLLWEAAGASTWSIRIRHAMVAGVALASAVGLSIYVTLVFGAFLAVWTMIAAARRWWTEVASYVVAGATALMCAFPYLLDLRGPAGGASGPPLEVHVRPFSAAVAMLQSVGIKSGWQMSLANLAMLPLNYFLELGFFFAAGRIWWSRRKRPLERAELATGVMLAVALLICTFVRSSVISNNDLGWRGILVAQFVLVLWGVDVVTVDHQSIDRPVRRVLALLLVLGFAGTGYDIFIERFYPVLADRGVVATLGWMARDRQLGPRNYAQREAYEWMNKNTAPDATYQFNPHVILEETSAFLYAERQIVAEDETCLANFGGDPKGCPPMQMVLSRVYPVKGQPAPESLAEACGALPVSIFVAKDTDVVWHDAESWVWKDRPVFANAYIRLFSCGATGASSQAR